MATSDFKPTVPRVFAASDDYLLRSKTDPNAFVFFEDANPQQPHTNTLIAICLPGIGDTRRQFRKLAPMLLDQLHCRVLVGDLRGFGDSTDHNDDPAKPYKAYSPEGVADDLVQLMDELSAAHPHAQFVLLGNSLAAGAVAIAATQRPARTKALVLLGPIVRDSSVDTWFRPLTHVLFPALYGRALWIPHYKTLYPGATKPDDWHREIALLDRHLRDRKTNIRNVGAFCRATKRDAEAAVVALGARDELAKIRVLAFYGRKDPDYADVDKELAWVRGAVPHIRVEVEADGGHYPHVEVPEKVMRAIEDMLDA